MTGSRSSIRKILSFHGNIPVSPCHPCSLVTVYRVVLSSRYLVRTMVTKSTYNPVQYSIVQYQLSIINFILILIPIPTVFLYVSHPQPSVAVAHESYLENTYHIIYTPQTPHPCHVTPSYRISLLIVLHIPVIIHNLYITKPPPPSHLPPTSEIPSVPACHTTGWDPIT